jgi:hypothetical protein
MSPKQYVRHAIPMRKALKIEWLFHYDDFEIASSCSAKAQPPTMMLSGTG